MNQLFYNIAGGIVHQIRCEKRLTISEVIVRSKRIKHKGNWFNFIFSVESSSFKLNNFKTEKFTLTFKDWNRPVCLLFGFTRVTFCQNLLHFTLGQWSESWRLWCQVSFSVVFLSFKNSNAREKVRKLSSFWDWWAESLFVSFIVPKYNILHGANLTMAARAKKNFWLSNLLTPSARECTIEIWSTLTYTEFDCVALLVML